MRVSLYACKMWSLSIWHGYIPSKKYIYEYGKLFCTDAVWREEVWNSQGCSLKTQSKEWSNLAKQQGEVSPTSAVSTWTPFKMDRALLVLKICSVWFHTYELSYCSLLSCPSKKNVWKPSWILFHEKFQSIVRKHQMEPGAYDWMRQWLPLNFPLQPHLQGFPSLHKLLEIVNFIVIFCSSLGRTWKKKAVSITLEFQHATLESNKRDWVAWKYCQEKRGQLLSLNLDSVQKVFWKKPAWPAVAE